MYIQRSSLWTFITLALWLEVDSCSKDNLAVGICLHTYLERDFPAMQGNIHGQYGADGRRYYAENGPQLLSHCESMAEALECFRKNLEECRNIKHFSEYTQLLNSLTKTHDWLCENMYLRDRFLVLLQALRCLEKMHTGTSPCSDPSITPNIWQKILRLEVDQSICPSLQRQRICLLHPHGVEQNCGHEVLGLYQNMSGIFLDNWCNKSSVKTHIPVSLLFLLILAKEFLIT